jgi:hypothetical protein
MYGEGKNFEYTKATYDIIEKNKEEHLLEGRKEKSMFEKTALFCCKEEI